MKRGFLLQMLETSYQGLPKYPYKTLLKKTLPSDVDDTNKHVRYANVQHSYMYTCHFINPFIDQFVS